MSNKRIVVANNYKNAFEAIGNLIENGCLDNAKNQLSVSGRGADRVIHGGAYDYVLGSETGSGIEDDIYIASDGASWFRNFRKECSAERGESKNQNAVWVAFLEKIAKAYHYKYSLVEYRQRKPSAKEAEENEKVLVGYLDNIIGLFYPELGAYSVRAIPPGENSSDIYSVSLCLDLSSGTGAPKHILCTIYFKASGKEMIPIRSEEANGIDSYLKEIPDGAESSDFNVDPNIIIDKTLDALDRFIKDPDGDFVSCMCYGDKLDEENVKSLYNSKSTAMAELDCTLVKVLGISHVKWNNNAADVIIGSRPVLRAEVSLGNKLTVKCLACKEGKELISGNVIEYVDEYGEAQSAVIDPEREDLGLTNRQIADIAERSELGKHLMLPSCADVRTFACSRLVCASEALVVDRNGRNQYLCKDCPHPNIVYKGLDPHGNAEYTPDLAYATDKGDLVRRDETAFCSCCGRRFTVDALDYNDRCELCASSATETEAARAAYRKYSGMLPPWVRLNGAGKHLCFEDDEILLFVLGKTRYAFNKIDIEETGFLPPPRKLNGRF